MILEEIKTDAWQLGINKPDEVLLDLDDINQCILIIANTQKGSDPINPLLGVDLMKWIDKPITDLVPGLISEITTQVGIFEKRATIKKISYTITESQVFFFINWTTTTGLPGQTNVNYAR
jgi:phage baseplate assembly protein W